jgi:nucleotide-binding universal stress UspA family protein
MAYETILVGINFDPLSKIALDAAAQIATRTDAKRIHIVHVAEIPPNWAIAPVVATTGPFELSWDAALRMSKQRLENIDRPATTAKITHETRIGSPAREIAQAAVDEKADLIVISSHRRGRVGRLVIGSVASAILRASPCPVLVVGEDRPRVRSGQEVLAAIDLSPISSTVLEHAARWAGKPGRVRIVSIDDIRDTMARLPPEAFEAISLSDAILHFDERYRAALDALAARIRAPGREVEVEVHMNGIPREVILGAARKREPDLIIVGTSGHNAWQRLFLGSTASHVVQEAPCPVLVVPTPHDKPDAHTPSFESRS